MSGNFAKTLRRAQTATVMGIGLVAGAVWAPAASAEDGSAITGLPNTTVPSTAKNLQIG